MADLLLTHGYVLAEDEKEQQIMRPYPPLGLLSLSAYLGRAGFDVETCDLTLGSRDVLLARLAARAAPVVGLYTTMATRRAVLDLAAAARAHGSTVVLGGPDAATYPDEYLARGADVVVPGEGETTVEALLPALAARGPHRLHGVAGTIFRDERGEVVRNPDRPHIADLDSLPWPDRAAADIPAYLDLWRRHHGMGSVNVITARGCPFTCSWCSHAVYGFTHRRRSVLDCADEVEDIRDAYHPDQLWYADDVFTIHHGWLLAYRAELKRRGLRVPFETISRADRLQREEVVEALADMGCRRIWIGGESGSQRILDAMRRGVTRAQIESAVALARRHGIEVGLFLMWGYDGETMEDMAETVDLVRRARPDTFFTTVAYPIPGTAYHEAVRDRVSLPIDWVDASDRDYLVSGRLGRPVYKLADAWLRADVEVARAAGADPGQVPALRVQAERARAAFVAAATPGAVTHPGTEDSCRPDDPRPADISPRAEDAR